MRTFSTTLSLYFIIALLSLSAVRSQPGPPQGPSPGGFPGGPSGFPGGPSGFPGNPGGFPVGGPGNVGNPGGFGSINPQPFGFGAGGNTAGFGNLGTFGNVGGFTGTPGFGNIGGFGGTQGLAGFGGAQGLGGFGVPRATPGFGNAGFAPVGGVGGGQFGAPLAGGVGNVGNVGLRPIGAAGGVGGAPISGTNALASLFAGQNIGAGMSVDQMRQLDGALFNGGANIFQTEQPSATFSYPVDNPIRPSSPLTTNTYTTQQFSPMAPTPGNPMLGPVSPVGPMGVGASNLLSNALLGGVANNNYPSESGQLSTNPAYSSLTNGFNNLLSGVGAGLANAGRDISLGYAPPNPSANPNYNYVTNPNNQITRPTIPTSQTPYSGGQQQTLTATYPGIGTVNLGVPAVSQQTLDTVNAQNNPIISSANPSTTQQATTRVR